jgi:hypothetical protein
MIALDRLLLQLVARSATARVALQRWALRFAARMLRRLGPAHQASADLLQVLGDAPVHRRGATMTGIIPKPRRPAAIAIPRMPQLNVDRNATRPYLAEPADD